MAFSFDSAIVCSKIGFKWWSLEWQIVGNKWWSMCSPNEKVMRNKLWLPTVSLSLVASIWHNLKPKVQSLYCIQLTEGLETKILIFTQNLNPAWAHPHHEILWDDDVKHLFRLWRKHMTKPYELLSTISMPPTKFYETWIEGWKHSSCH